MPHFQFNPANYNTTLRVVTNLHHGKTTSMGNEVVVEYRTSEDLMSLFFRIRVHVQTPADVDKPLSYHEIRQRKRNVRYQLFLYAIAAILVIAAITIIALQAVENP